MVRGILENMLVCNVRNAIAVGDGLSIRSVGSQPLGLRVVSATIEVYEEQKVEGEKGATISGCRYAARAVSFGGQAAFEGQMTIGCRKVRIGESEVESLGTNLRNRQQTGQ